MADRFATRLPAEVQRWVRDGLLSAQQAERILAGVVRGSLFGGMRDRIKA
jgi:hypothetical protein